MAQHHTEQEIFDFITGDFQCAWDALADKPEGVAGNRGNFMFALQATILLEWVGQLCDSDVSGTARTDFAAELQKIEPRYFTEIDGTCRQPGTFTRPSVLGHDPLTSLLGAIWDLVRNGQAHQYQDIIVTLVGGKQWALSLQGAKHGWPLSEVAKNRSTLKHLSYYFDSAGDLVLIVHPGAFFLDVREATQNAKLLARGLKITHFTRGGVGRQTYQFDVNQLELALKKGGLVAV